MASEDTKGKKRKGAPESAPKAKKPRKSDDVAAASKPTKAPKPTAAKPASKKASRKEAADFFSDNDAPAVEPAQGEVKSTKAKKKSKKEGKAPDADIEEAPVVKAPTEKTKSKKAKTAPVEADAVAEAQVETAVKKAKKAKSNKKQAEPEEQDVEAEVAVTEVEEADDVDDDQTAALLAGFESDDEENDPEDDEDFEENAVVPKLSKKQLTALEKATKGARSNEPGVVYVGRVPRGFFESQMKKYFSQFGKVNRLRLSRNKKTGASKHYAFVEFASTEVADIVARTMDNYLLFGHILKCKLVPADQVHPDLFKGAGSRFKVEPRNKKAGLQMERGVERAQWEKRVETENKRRSGRNKALQEEFGYTYTVPIVKSVDSVPKQLENGAPQQLVDAPVEEQPKPKKSKKVAKITEEQPGESAQPAAEKRAKKATKAKIAIEADVQAEIAAEIADVVPEKKSKKDKKRTSDVVLESTAAVEEVVAPESATKTKKAKKEGKSAVDESVAGKKRAAKADQEVTKPKKAKKAKA